MMSTPSGRRHPVLTVVRVRTSRHACKSADNGVWCSHIGNARVRRRRAILTDASRRTASGRGVREGACGCSPGLTLWLAAAETASWERPQRVLEEHPRASLIRGDLVVFRIKGNDYRLAARIDFANGIVRIVAVGAHAEYDRWRL
jgi:mRNA interferase HigB